MTHRFGVFFFARGVIPNPLDIRFQEVTGLQASISTRDDPTAASSLYQRKIPNGITYVDLELKRGMVLGSPLRLQVQKAFNDFTFTRSDVLLTIYSETGLPITAFLFSEAIPISWQISNLDAKSEDFLIETLKLSYTRMRPMSL
ncbi:MAG: phage tail protein [Synechococcaceae cyanobacterium]|nr:phage tail protein [Synechococcaceae cyanobacterium]